MASPNATYYLGDTLDVLRTMPSASVELILSSPPFLALRSYLSSDNPLKAREMGSEPNPGAFIDALLDVVEECARVLSPHGSLVFELGDSYAGSGGSGGDYRDGGRREGQPEYDGSARRGSARVHADGYGNSIPARRVGNVAYSVRNSGNGWPMAKSLCLVPEAFRLALAYGVNMFTGRQTDPWRIRNVVRWCKPNPAPGFLGDKFRPATTELVVATKSGTRYFDLDGVRRPYEGALPTVNRSTVNRGNAGYHTEGGGTVHVNPAGAPPLDWWRVSTQPYRGAHFATWPEKLLHTPIISMCPEFVCVTCGEPRKLITTKGYVDANGTPVDAGTWPSGIGSGEGAHSAKTAVRSTTTTTTIGWTDCGHDSYRRGVVLDPFAGTGTTLLVANQLDRDGVGIDLNPANAELARQRVGDHLVVVGP